MFESTKIEHVKAHFNKWSEEGSQWPSFKWLVDSKNYELTSGQEDQAPVGLGTGLASLDAKKQKAKAKAAA